MVLVMVPYINTLNPFYNHIHFSHDLVCVTHFLVIIHFDKKHHFFESLSHLSVAQNICKFFNVNVIVMSKSKTNIKILYIVIPFGNANIAFCSSCAN
jgi:hypothetical protein